MGQVLIRNLDDAVIADYKQLAAARGRSLEAELRNALTAMRPKQRLSKDGLIALVNDLWATSPLVPCGSDSTDLIREDRAAR